jgi:hypothetical protein
MYRIGFTPWEEDTAKQLAQLEAPLPFPLKRVEPRWYLLERA